MLINGPTGRVYDGVSSLIPNTINGCQKKFAFNHNKKKETVS